MFVCCSIGAPVLRADEAANEAARELARRVAEKLNPKTNVAFTFRDPAGLISDSELADAQSSFSVEMSAHGIKSVTPEAADVVVRVTLSESFSANLWIAEFEKGENLAPLFISSPKRLRGTGADDLNRFRVQATRLFETKDVILDYAIVKNQGGQATEILVLEAGSISLYDFADGQWRLTKALPAAHMLATSRDPRGHIFYLEENGEFAAGMPDSFCKGKAHAGLKLECDPLVRAWTVATGEDSAEGPLLTKGRNFFLFPVLTSHGSSPNNKDSAPNLRPYYSSTTWMADSGGVLLQTLLDGRVLLTTQGSTLPPLPVNWGSDLVSIRANCENETVVLSTGSSDYTSADFLQAFELKGGAVVAVSARTEFPGPITALWPDLNGNNARIIVHNLTSGNYEAYQITLACDH